MPRDNDNIIDLATRPADVITIDAREAYEALQKAAETFIGRPGGGIQVTAAIIELFDMMLSRANPQARAIFISAMRSKCLLLESLDTPDLGEPN